MSLFAHIALMPSKLLPSIESLTKITEKPKEKRIKLIFNKRKPKKLKQMVTTEKRNLEIEKEAKYYSKFDNATERETKASRVDKFNKAGKGNALIDSKAQKITQKKSKKNKSDKAMKKSKNGTKKFSFADFAVTKPTQALKKQKQLVKGLKNGDVKSKGLASNNDYLDDVPLGDMTQLNTKENMYYGFYFRIKQRLEQHWGKSLRDKMDKLYRRKGRFPASDKHMTSLKVTIDDKGNIVEVFIKGSSGVSELDEAAVESFNKAGPFPNPPSGMVKNGRASIEWGFAVTRS